MEMLGEVSRPRRITVRAPTPTPLRQL